MFPFSREITINNPNPKPQENLIIPAQQIQKPIPQATQRFNKPSPIPGTIFSEVSNHPNNKLEAQAIYNTILNRSKALGIPPEKVVTQPNQYQGYNSPQFKAYYSPNKDFPSQQKAKIVDSVIKSNPKDITGGAQFYYHPQYNRNLANIGNAYFTKDYKDLQKIIKMDMQAKK